MCEKSSLNLLEHLISTLYTHRRACKHTCYVYLKESRGNHYVSQRTAESSCFLSVCRFPSRNCLALTLRATLSISPAMHRDPSLSPRMGAYARANNAITHYREQENTGLLRSVMKSFPAALPRESSLPSAAHAPMNTWHRSQPLAYCVHEILHYAFSKVAVSSVALSPRQPLRTLMKKMME